MPPVRERIVEMTPLWVVRQAAFHEARSHEVFSFVVYHSLVESAGSTLSCRRLFFILFCHAQHAHHLLIISFQAGGYGMSEDSLPSHDGGSACHAGGGTQGGRMDWKLTREMHIVYVL